MPTPENPELDDEMYERAQQMHGRADWRYQPISLKEHCKDYFVYGAKRWVSYYESSKFNVFQTMPDFLRDQLLESLSAYSDDYQEDHPRNFSFEVWAKFIYLLMKKNLKKVDLESLLGRFEVEDFKRDYVLKILAKLAKESPNLEEFSFSIPSNFRRRSTCNILYSLTSFKNLTFLALEDSDRIGNMRLQKICLSFPCLVFLKLELAISISPQGLANLKQLKGLRVFRFQVTEELYRRYHCSTYEMHMVFNWCAQNLPHLDYLGSCQSSRNDDFENFGKYPLKFSGTCQLLQLYAAKGLPKACLPNLHTLRFKGPVLDVNDLVARVALYQKLTTLILNDVAQEHTLLILECVGHQLVALGIISEDRFPDFKILALCPKLVELRNEGFDDQSDSNLNRASVKIPPQLLEYFSLEFYDGKPPKGLLKMLLASPVLETVKLENMPISKEDCQILSQLRSFSLKKIALECLEPLNCSPRDLEMMVRSLVLNSPNLTSIQVSVNGGQLFNDCKININKFCYLVGRWAD